MWTGTGPDGKQYQMNVERGPDGTPQVVIYDKNGNVVGGPIPLLWANGLGGSLMFNPDTGKISINNEFPFALNPSFQNYGGGGLGMITPGLAPWGGRPSQAAKTTTVSPEKAPNILAQLPWMPEGYEMFLFVALAAFSLMLVRIKVGKRK
jgi:hypothetical protein